MQFGSVCSVYDTTWWTRNGERERQILGTVTWYCRFTRVFPLSSQLFVTDVSKSLTWGYLLPCYTVLRRELCSAKTKPVINASINTL